MDAGAPQILIALESSGLGLAIRQSVWAYPAANVGHVVSLVLFAGCVAVLDLLLLGVIRVDGRAQFLARARSWAMRAFLLVALTGTVLFIAEASHVALNRVFQLKVALIVAALLNATIFGARAVAAAADLPETAPMPAAVRAAAIASLSLWLGVVALGRFIAYV
ncbi:MAG: DUF6644 family protein [Hyphomicrobiaceae bacterium]